MRINKIKQLSERDHMLLRPGQYIGATTLTKVPAFIFNEDTNKFEFTQISYVPALLKIISEIIDNALDEAVRTDFKYANKINIEISDTSVKVVDNGRGIPLAVDPDSGVSQLELALAYPRAGTNFNDDERNSIGMNGIGSYATNVMSTKFKAVSITGKEKGVLTCSNNLDKRKCTINSYISDKIGTTVEFEPDMSRFEVDKIDDTHKNLVYQRILFLSISYPEITFKFNGKIIRFRNAKNFLSSFNENFAQINTEKYLIGIVPNSSDDFNSKSVVNGADCINGGNHIDYIHSELIGRIKTKLEKKYPNIKPGDIKNKLTYVVTIRDFKSPLFDSQTKEKFTSNISDIKSFFGDIDWDKLVNQIIKTPEIIDPIIETFKIREELKSRQALNKLNKGVTKNFKCEKFLPATKNQKFMFICEGLCIDQNQEVFTGKGNIPLKDIEIGDAVLTHNQNIKQVISKTKKIAKCFKITLKSGKTIQCSAEHRFFVYDTIKRSFIWKKLKDINKNTDKLINNKLINNFYLSDIHIEQNTKYQSKKYPLHIWSDNFEVFSSYNHSFVVFNKNEEKFYVKYAKNINVDSDMMVLLNKL